jgi:hypothetical protein
MPRRFFDRLGRHGLDWRVYYDPPSHISLTGILPMARSRPEGSGAGSARPPA